MDPETIEVPTLSEDDLPFDPEGLGLHFADILQDLQFSANLDKNMYLDTRSNVSRALKSAIDRVVTIKMEKGESLEEIIEFCKSSSFTDWMAQGIVHHVLERHTELVFLHAEKEKTDKMEAFVENHGYNTNRTGPTSLKIENAPEESREIVEVISQFYEQYDGEPPTTSLEKIE